jgi:putative membrane protein
MTKFILRWAINIVALYVAIFILLGRGISYNGSWISVIWLALIFGLINALLRPLLKLLTCPLIILTIHTCNQHFPFLVNQYHRSIVWNRLNAG